VAREIQRQIPEAQWEIIQGLPSIRHRGVKLSLIPYEFGVNANLEYDNLVGHWEKSITIVPNFDAYDRARPGRMFLVHAYRRICSPANQ
jgi:hypothetical protein